MTPTRLSRRSALKFAALAAAPMIVPAHVLGLDGATPPSGKVNIGFIGCGTHGLGYNLPSFLQQDDCVVAAVCDVFADRVTKAQQVTDKHYGKQGCKGYADFRELLADKSIDAVCISTPDHWHTLISTMALNAGKDVMCEKPTLTIAEGRPLVELVAAKKAVFQIGLEDRSLIYYHKLAEWCRMGAIGKLQTIRVKLPAGEVFRKEDPAPVPAGLNWEMWLGPAPFHPFTPTRTGAQQWRQIREYSGGKFTDWGAHLLDTCNVANSAEDTGPVEVEGEGKIPENSMNTMPSTYKLHYRYANGVEMFVESGGVGIKFEGDKGWVGNTGWRGKLEASSDEILKTKYDPETSKIWKLPPSEHRNFLDCIKSRKPTTYTAEAGQRLSTTMHIGNIAMWLGRKVKWDPTTESFPGDDAANALRSRPLREDWKTKV